MNEATGVFEARLQTLEHRHSALLASHTNLRDRYESLLKVTKDLAGHAADASRTSIGICRTGATGREHSRCRCEVRCCSWRTTNGR